MYKCRKMGSDSEKRKVTIMADQLGEKDQVSQSSGMACFAMMGMRRVVGKGGVL